MLRMMIDVFKVSLEQNYDHWTTGFNHSCVYNKLEKVQILIDRY